jgi:acetylornithine deacetylase/succinyl-diaminopimelate desuccinylase-like protein
MTPPFKAASLRLLLVRVLVVTGAALAVAASMADAPAARAQNATEASHVLARAIFQELIEINTTDSVGSVTAAAAAMQKRFLDAGFAPADVHLLGPNDRKQNLVVRLRRGAGAQKPILLIGHLDVVEARREDWTTDPFHFLEKDGYFYGRGTQDMKDGDAILVANLLRLKQEGYQPSRDIVLALTADEEGGKSNGVDWLLTHHRELIDAEFVLNPDGGGVETEHGKPVIFAVDASEKMYADYQLIVTNAGGHSSLPRPDNAIYELTEALGRLQHFSFPVELNPVTRAYFAAESKLESGQVAEDMRAMAEQPPAASAVERLSANPEYNALLRTTCVATRLDAGHANNALPQRAAANVNCRILPGHSKEEIRQQLITIFAQPKMTVHYVDNAGQVFDQAPVQQALPEAKLLPQVMAPLNPIVSVMWPNTPIVPTMATGASDGIYTNAAGLPTYGISGVAIDRDDVRAHGRDERVPVESFYRGVDFYYSYLKALTGGH